MKTKIIVVTGPTGAGKSAAAVALAERFDGEIIGADSMQIYRELDIGTAKILTAEKRGVPHHMIDVAEPNQKFSAGDYVDMAKRIITDVSARKKLPVIVGGTGLYIKSLLMNHTFCGVQRDDDVRLELTLEAEKFGTAQLFNRLVAVDTISAQKIAPSDLKRIVRALEIHAVTGRTKSQLLDNFCSGAGESDYDYLFFVLMAGQDSGDRKALYGRIDERVERMFSAGLIDEVRALNMQPDWQASQAIGYKEVLEYLAGKVSQAEMIDKLKMNTRRYAKRQLTYFRNIGLKTIWIDVLDNPTDNMSKMIEDFLRA